MDRTFHASLRIAPWCTALALVFVSACTNTPAVSAGSSSAAPELPGKAIATDLCSGCHAIARTDQSPHPDAMPFRKISMHYPVRNLEEALGEGIFVGHPDMPPFQLSPEDIDALLEYIESIQAPT